MSSRILHVVTVTFLVVSFAAQSGLAAAFDEQFTITKVTGTCSVKAPGALRYSPAEEGKAYPYGAKLKTAKASSAVIKFSDGNQCIVQAQANLAITQDTKNASHKVLKLNAGKIEVELEEGFHENNSLDVQTPTAVCGAIGCGFSALAETAKQMANSAFSITEGTTRITHPDGYFAIPLLDAGDAVSVAVTPDGNLIVVTVEAGAFDIVFTDENDQVTKVEIEKGTVVEILKKLSKDGKKIILVIVITDKDGNQQTITIVIGDPPPVEEGKEEDSRSSTTIRNVTPTGQD